MAEYKFTKLIKREQHNHNHRNPEPVKQAVTSKKEPKRNFHNYQTVDPIPTITLGAECYTKNARPIVVTGYNKKVNKTTTKEVHQYHCHLCIVVKKNTKNNQLAAYKKNGYTPSHAVWTYIVVHSCDKIRVVGDRIGMV